MDINHRILLPQPQPIPPTQQRHLRRIHRRRALHILKQLRTRLPSQLLRFGYTLLDGVDGVRGGGYCHVNVIAPERDPRN
jgi:hypothetical protein